jgi:hypothetical protein
MAVNHIFHPGGHTTLMPGGSLTYSNTRAGGEQDQSALYAQPGQFAHAIGKPFDGFGMGMSGVAGGMGQVGAGMGNAISGHSQAMAGHSGAIANNYNAYAGGNAALANALANERSSAYGAMAQGEAARQLAAGNIANQSLAAYGGMGNAAMSAWAQNQSSYNQALQNMFTGNQTAASQLGQSRNQALSKLGEATSSLGMGLGAAGVIGNVDFGMGGMGGGGMGFDAMGPDGRVASGSYSGGMGGMGGMNGGGSRGPGPEFAGTSDRSFGLLDSLRGDVMDNTFLDNLENARRDGFNRLDQQHYSSRTQPFDFMGTAFNDIQNLARPGYDATRQGMDQLYGNLNANRADFSEFTRNMRDGFGTSSQDLRDNAGRMSSDFQSGMRSMDGVLGGLSGLSDTLGSGLNSTQTAIRDLFDNSLGNMRVFQSPLQRAQATQAERDFLSRTQLQDGISAAENRLLPGSNLDRMRQQLLSFPKRS